MKLTYEKCSDYLIPNLIPNWEPEEELRKFGRMRLQYLKEHSSGVYLVLFLAGKQKERLLAVQEQAKQRFDVLEEQLKAADQMLWLRKMNGIWARAEEVVRGYIIYVI